MARFLDSGGFTRSGPWLVLLRMAVTLEGVLKTILAASLPSSLTQQPSPQVSLFPPILCLGVSLPIQVLRFYLTKNHVH